MQCPACFGTAVLRQRERCFVKYAGSPVRKVTQLVCPLLTDVVCHSAAKSTSSSWKGESWWTVHARKSNHLMAPALSSFSTWKTPWTLETVDWQFLKSFVHTVSFLMCQYSFKPTLETLNETCCCVGNSQCEKGKGHQTLSPPCLTYAPGSKWWQRNPRFKKQKVSITILLLF